MTLPLQVAFLTGQSDPGRCALSPAQERFLDALPVPEGARVRSNFPYTPATLAHRRVPLWRASVNNARQYLASQRSAFALRHAPNVIQLLARADRTILLAGSAGLELLGNLRLERIWRQRVHVFAYGPVTHRRPGVHTFAVRGRSDWIARCSRGPVEAEVDCGHMNYLECAEVRILCAVFVGRVRSTP